jgi:hypothetical protein
VKEEFIRIANALERIANSLEQTAPLKNKGKRTDITKWPPLKKELLKLGTLDDVADTLNVGKSTICGWYERGIPPKQALRLELRLNKEGLAQHLLSISNREWT